MYRMYYIMDELHKKITYKLGLLKLMGSNSDTYTEKINMLNIRYELVYTNIVNKITTSNETEQKNILITELTKENILDSIITLFNDIASNNTVDNMLINNFTAVNIPFELITNEYEICMFCGNKIELSTDKVLMVCYKCGQNKDIPLFLMETRKNTPKSVRGNFKPNRHLKGWLDHLLAREPESEICSPDDPDGSILISDLKEIARKKNIKNNYILIDDIRDMLKILDKTHLNKNTSLLAKKITGRGPPIFTSESYQKIYSMVLVALDAREKIKGKSKHNRRYYPYYIYKCVDISFTGDERRLLNYIHIHSSGTLTFNDIEWMDVCEESPLFKNLYTPTILPKNRYLE